MKWRLDRYLADRQLVPTRSQAESAIRLGKVTVNGRNVTKAGTFVDERDEVKLHETERYVSRAGLKLASVAQLLGVEFADKTVLDVGSSTGGFTDYALQHGAKRVVAVDVGTEQLHSSLRRDKRIELYEKTDIRRVYRAGQTAKLSATASRPSDLDYVSRSDGAREASDNLPSSRSAGVELEAAPDIVVIDVSFISLREILPHIADNLSGSQTHIIAMLKPQFEAGRDQVNKGVIKNNKVRRQILTDFEAWSRQYFVTLDKRDSQVAGAKGNLERFYLLKATHNKASNK